MECFQQKVAKMQKKLKKSVSFLLCERQQALL